MKKPTIATPGGPSRSRKGESSDGSIPTPKPQRIEDLRESAWAALDDDPERAVDLARAALRLLDDAEGRYLLAQTLLELGEVDEAVGELEKATSADESHVDAWAALGHLLFEDCHWDEARSAVSTALRLDPHHPEALYYRACLRERRGDHDGAARDYSAAAAEAPEEFPTPLSLDDEEIGNVTAEVLSQLHPSLQDYLADVPILVEELPEEDTLDKFTPPMSPTELVACFSGPSLTERSTLAPWTALPATITIYRRNLARLATDRSGAVEELRITLLHEIGHFLGLDEEDLAERGLD